MKPLLTLTVLLLLSACATTVGLGTSPICSIPQPTLSEQDTGQTIIEVDNYLAKIRAVCQ